MSAKTETKINVLDVWADALALLRACGPCGAGWIAHELLVQTRNVTTKEEAAQHADKFIRDALERRVIEVYDASEAYPTYIVRHPVNNDLDAVPYGC